MADCSMYPLGSAQRILCAAGITSDDASRKQATTFWYVVIATIIIAMAIDYNPVLGGWLLLLAIASLVLINKQGYNIVSSATDKKVSNL